MPPSQSCGPVSSPEGKCRSGMTPVEIFGFFLAGLFNNSSYVIMIAGAKNIAPSMVGLV